MSRKHVSSNLFPWDRHTLPLGYLNVKKVDCIVFLLNMNVVVFFQICSLFLFSINRNRETYFEYFIHLSHIADFAPLKSENPNHVDMHIEIFLEEFINFLNTLYSYD